MSTCTLCGEAMCSQIGSWSCHICEDERPDCMISVVTTDVSEDRGLPYGTLIQNVRYCNDRDECHTRAQTHRLVKPVEGIRAGL